MNAKAHTCRHEEWNVEFAAQNATAEAVKAAALERQDTADENVQHDAQTLKQHNSNGELMAR